MTANHEAFEQYAGEARSLLTFGSNEQIEIQLGHLCNNRCVFCPSGQLTEVGMAGQLPPEPVLATLDEAAQRGVRKVTFVGGEPTLQRTFLAILKHAKQLGFEEIVIFTNGVTSKHRRFIDDVVGAGRFTWRFSIQGGNESAHDAATLKPGSFAKIIQGLTHLQGLDQHVTANMCVNEFSYRSLPDYPELIARYGVKQLHIDMVRPNNTGVRTDEYLQSIMPRYSDIAPYVATMLEGFDVIDPEFDVNVGNLPYCVLPQWAHKIHHGGQLTVIHTLDGDGGRDATNKYEYQRSDMQHPPQCDACVFKPECRGVADKYVQFYGMSEFQPVSLGDLRAIDTGHHFFVLEVDDRLRPLTSAAPPAGWRHSHFLRSTRDRRCELRFEHACGAAATLIFTPPTQSTEDFDWTIAGEGSLSFADALQLVRWAEGVVGIAAPLDPCVIAERLFPLFIAKRRERLMHYVDKITAKAVFAEWSVTKSDLDAYAAAIALQRGDGASLHVRLSVDADPARKPVSASFSVPATADCTAAISEIAAALRG
jgi:sulfatase maturation enzyme AslB (radical SAM superfamily)